MYTRVHPPCLSATSAPVCFAAVPLPIWVYSVRANRCCWANDAAVDFWEAASVEEFAGRDLSQMSQTIRRRLLAIDERLAAGAVITEAWTLFPRNAAKTVRLTIWGTDWDGAPAMVCMALPEEGGSTVHVETEPARILAAVAASAERFLGAADWRSELPGMLERIGTAAEMDRCYYLALDNGTDGVSAGRTWIATRVCEWCTPGIATSMDAPSGRVLDMIENGFGPWVETLLRGEPVVMNSLDQVSDRARVHLVGQQVDAVTLHPIHVDGQLRGAIGLHLCLSQRPRQFTGWSAPAIRALAAGGHILAAAIAMTETRMQLVRALASAEAASSTRSQFLATMSHELRTPLNAINGFSEMMAKEMLGPLGSAAYLSYANDINESGQFLLRLIDDVLDMAKMEAGRWELTMTALSLSSAVQPAVTMVRDLAARAGIHLTVTSTEGLPQVRADRNAVQRMLTNLLSNAIKFTGDGGQVTVSASATATGWVEVVVRDTGRGIAEADLPFVMQPFSQVRSLSSSSDEGGTGLGLAIVKSLIELHGGLIRLDSAVGSGTAVTLRFPPFGDAGVAIAGA